MKFDDFTKLLSDVQSAGKPTISPSFIAGAGALETFCEYFVEKAGREEGEIAFLKWLQEQTIMTTAEGIEYLKTMSEKYKDKLK